MSKEKISSQEIIDLLSAQTDFTKRQSEDFLKAMFGIIEERLIAGETVKIKNLGTFKSQWNESRKSVNVQTGEEFVIPGFRKISFTPDSELKNLVNEPYAHLEAVVLDSNHEVTEVDDEDTEELEPLNILTEQALEIKGLLSEIQGIPLTKDESKIEAEATVEIEENNTAEIPLESIIQIDPSTENLFDKIQEKMHQKSEELSSLEVVEITKDESEIENSIIEIDDNIEPELIVAANNEESKIEAEEEIKINEEIKIQENDQTETKSNYTAPEISTSSNVYEEEKIENHYTENIIENNDKDEITSIASDVNRVSEANNLIDNSLDPVDYKIKRKSKWWLILIIILLAIILGLIATYFLSSATRCWVKYELFSDENKEKTANVKNNILNIFGLGDPEIAPKPAKIEQDSVAIQAVAEDSIKVDSIPVTQSKDTIVDVFNRPRVYDEFIGTEKFGQGNTLTNISKKYYGHKDFWVYIYEANKDKIKNPDNISVGTSIRIPKIDPRLIDLGNPICLKKAKELHDLYIEKK